MLKRHEPMNIEEIFPGEMKKIVKKISIKILGQYLYVNTKRKIEKLKN